MQKFESYADAHNEFLQAVDAELTELTKRQADIKKGVAKLLGSSGKRTRKSAVLSDVPPAPPKLERQTAMNLEHWMREQKECAACNGAGECVDCGTTSSQIEEVSD